jgi:putative flippase GtrA
MLKKQAFIFLFVGGSSVLIDYTSYILLTITGLDRDISKGLGFLSGAIFAYYANKKVTFNYSGPKRIYQFIVIYVISLVLNISINSASLELLPQTEPATNVAFILATIVSASFNFLGMKYYAFK